MKMSVSFSIFKHLNYDPTPLRISVRNIFKTGMNQSTSSYILIKMFQIDASSGSKQQPTSNF